MFSTPPLSGDPDRLRRRVTLSDVARRAPFSTGTAPAPLDGPGCCTLLALATLRGRQAVESETTPPAERGASRFPAASVPTCATRQCESSLRRSAGPRLFQRLFRFTGSSFGSLARWHLCTYSHAATRRRKSKAANEPSGSAYTTLHWDAVYLRGPKHVRGRCSTRLTGPKRPRRTSRLARGLSCKGRVQGPPRGGSGERRRPHAASARACFCLEHGSCIIELRLCHTCVRLVVTKIRHAEGIHGLREVASVADHRRCCALRT